ncbi:MAG: DUF7529 family protein, partial [archaeon]
ASALAESHREAGWEALVLQPANVVPIPVGPAGDDPVPDDTEESSDDVTDPTDAAADPTDDADVGLSFLLPRAVIELLADLAGRDPETEVVRGDHGEYLAVVVALRDPDAGAALVVPLTVHRPTATAMTSAARARGRLDLIARPADVEHRVEIPLEPDAVLGEQ